MYVAALFLYILFWNSILSEQIQKIIWLDLIRANEISSMQAVGAFFTIRSGVGYGQNIGLIQSTEIQSNFAAFLIKFVLAQLQSEITVLKFFTYLFEFSNSLCTTRRVNRLAVLHK